MRSITGQALRLVLLTGCFSLFMSGLSHAIEDLVLLDASFASQITDRHPSRVSAVGRSRFAGGLASVVLGARELHGRVRGDDRGKRTREALLGLVPGG